MLHIIFVMIRFQLVVPLVSHDVTKNLTGHRMHVDNGQNLSRKVGHSNASKKNYDIFCTFFPTLGSLTYMCDQIHIARKII